MGIKESFKKVQTNCVSFLADKPIWIYWIACTAVVALIFGLLYFIMYLLVLRWWVPVIVILAGGMIWGTIASKQRSSINEEAKEE